MIKLANVEKIYKAKFKNINDFDVMFKKGRLSVLYGSSGLGKTTIGIYISVLSSCGKDLFKGLIRVKQGKRVLYVSMELEREDLLSKFYPIMKYYRVKECNVDIIDYFDIHDINDLKDKFKDYDLVIIDSFSAIYDGKSINDVIEVKNYLMEMKKYASNNDCHILFIHHTNKSVGKDKYHDTYLGASTIKNQATLFMKVGKDRGTFIEIEKTNFSIPFKKIYYYINKQGLIRWYVKNVNHFNKYDNLIKLIKKEKEILVKDLIMLSDLKIRTLYKYLNELEELGIIKWKNKHTPQAFITLNNNLQN